MKNQGISLISLIITIIVIIILAAIVIFTGLGTPDSAQLASFTQQCDNVSSAVLNRYAKLYEKHGLSNEYRTQEQIYMEIASATNYSGDRSAGMTGDLVGCRNIVSGKTTETNNEFALGMTLPLVNNSRDGWYITKDGKVFNQTGFQHDNKVYYNGYTYSVGAGSSKTANQIAAAIAQDLTIVPAE